MKFITKAVREFREAYGGYYIPCLVDCAACCQDAPPMTFFEWQLIPEKNRALATPQPSPCPFLEETKCGIYEFRPTLCRVYGVPDTGELSCRAGVKAHWIDVNRFFNLWSQYSAALATDLLDYDDHKAPWLRYMKECKTFRKIQDGARMIREELFKAEYGGNHG